MIVHNTMQSRYQGTLLGWTWSYLQPFVRFCMFYFVFEVAIGRGGEETPNFAIHMVAGMVLVHFFTETFNGGTQSLVRNRSLITKLAVPKELFPVSRLLLAGWHTGPMLLIMLVACVLTGWTPDPGGIMAFLLGTALITTLGLALALLFSVANVYFRDFGKVVMTLNQFVTFSVPMIYPYTMVRDRFGELGSQLYLFNPVAEAVLLYQRAFWVGTTDDPEYIAEHHLPSDLWERGVVMLLALLWLAQKMFTRLEQGVPERL
jgi:ABC-2 type transport system permease protein